VIAVRAQDGSVLWRFAPQQNQGGVVYGQPAVAQGSVFVGLYSQSGRNQTGRVFALAQDTGDVRWQQVTGGAVVGGPTVAGDLVVVGSSDGVVQAFHIADGSLAWRTSINGKIWSSPAVSGDSVFFGSLDHGVYALDLADGSQKWTFETNGSVVARPLVVGDMVVVGSFDRNLYALDAATGELRWSFQGENWFWASPVTDGTNIYAACMDGKLYALDMEGRPIWSQPFDAGDPIVSTPVLLGDRILVASDSERGRIHLVSLRNGTQEWFYDLGARVRADLVGQDSLAIVSTLEHQVKAIEVRRAERWTLPTKG